MAVMAEVGLLPDVVVWLELGFEGWAGSVVERVEGSIVGDLELGMLADAAS